MVDIVPAIMAADREDLEQKVSRVLGIAPVIQIDVMDGSFVHNKSWPYIQGEHSGYDDDFLAILREDDGLPSWQDVDYEIDLMVSDPEQRAEDWIAAGAKRLVFHIESAEETSLLELLGDIRARFPKRAPSADDANASAEAFGGFTMELGIALGISTPVETLAPFIELGIDFVQCMGIQKIGFQGQPFDPAVADKVTEIRKTFPDVLVSVDGGVSAETAPLLAKAGADRLICGSALFERDDISEAYEEVNHTANSDMI